MQDSTIRNYLDDYQRRKTLLNRCQPKTLLAEQLDIPLSAFAVSFVKNSVILKNTLGTSLHKISFQWVSCLLPINYSTSITPDFLISHISQELIPNNIGNTRGIRTICDNIIIRTAKNIITSSAKTTFLHF
jgi:hypothetical protein